jgi:hypothetical protein
MLRRSCRSTEKESFWRSHLKRQASSGESIRGYCLRRGLSEASFHYWRREIADRDGEVVAATRSSSAGLVAVEIVGETSVRATITPTLEIECPGGAVIRLREEVSVDVLQRVMRACQQIQAEGVSVGVAVRSC